MSQWSCTLDSFAHVLNTPVRDLIHEIGHDGSEIIFPSLPDPVRRRAFHWQEFILPCLRRHYALVYIEKNPVIGAYAAQGILTHDLKETNINRFTDRFDGVIIGDMGGQSHAWGWKSKKLYDPAGSDFAPQSIRAFLAVMKIKSIDF